MNSADAEEYTQALGQVVAGGWRQVALGQRLGVPEALGISTQKWVEERLGGYVRLAIPERRDAVAELAQEGMSGRAIADVLGVDEGTVRNDKEARAENSAPQTESAPPDGADQTPRAENSAPQTELEADRPSGDEVADSNLALRHSRARKMLAKAAAATNELSPSIEQVAEAVVAQHPDQISKERDWLQRNRAVWDRLLKSVDELANPQLRRVK